MNERIRELAKEHGFVRWDYDSLSYELKGDIEDLYAFAELIVRECTKVLEIQGANTGQEQYHYGASLIEEHFGVLE